MERLTTPDGDYCRVECGQAGTCKRLAYAQQMNDLSLRCKDAQRYERLRMYENLDGEVDTVCESAEKAGCAFLKEAQACEAERARLERRVAQLKAQQKTDHSQELRDKLAAYQQMAWEMKIKSRCFRRRAAERENQA